MHQRAFGLSQWTVTAATAAAAGITVEQPEDPAAGSMHLAADSMTGRTLAGAAGIPVRAHFEGPCLSFHFAIIFFFLKKGPCASVGSPEPEFAWTSVPRFFIFIFYSFGLPAHCPVGERSWEGLRLVLGGRQLTVPLRASFKHQHLKRMGRSCGAVARSACFLHVLLTPEAVPMNVI